MATSDVEQPGWRWRVWPWRKTAAPEDLLPALAHYHSLDRHRVRNFIGGTVLLLFLFIYGFFFSAFVPAYFAFFTFPLIALGFLVIWALPDVNWAPTRALTGFFYASFISLIIWPNYLAIALPGLPWITMIRLTAFPMALLLLVCLSMSQVFRTEIKRVLSAASSIPILLGIFVVIQLYSIGMSNEIVASVQKFIVAQTTWTASFFVAAYIFGRPGEIKRWGMILWAMGIFVSLIAMWEFTDRPFAMARTYTRFSEGRRRNGLFNPVATYALRDHSISCRGNFQHTIGSRGIFGLGLAFRTTFFDTAFSAKNALVGRSVNSNPALRKLFE